MKINAKNYGLEVVIPETAFTSGFTYNIRQVFVLNGGDKGEPLHPSILGLMDKEKKLTRRLLLRLWSMWNFFKSLDNAPEPWQAWEIWEAHNKQDFNEFYHNYIDTLVNEIDDISLQYWNNAVKSGKFSACF